MKQALDFIKANMLALTCGVIAIAAMIALFVWPVPGMFAELQKQVSDRKEVFTSLNELNNATRTMPNIDPALTDAAPLTVFPTKAVIAEGQKAIESLKTGAKQVLAEAVKRNAQTLLVPNALPNPSSLDRNNFFQAYRTATAQYGENADKGIIRTVLHGTLPPTADELAATEATRSNEIRKNTLQTDARGVAQNQPQVDALIADMKLKLPKEEQVRRAENYKIYVSPLGVEIHPAMASVSDLNAVSIFNAQFSLWVQTTVLDAIADANGNSKNVLESPIKHLLKLTVPLNIADVQTGNQPMGFGAPAEGAAAPAVALTPDASIALTPKYDRDPLGYVSNAMYDPINVQMVLRVDATRLSESLAGLSKNHLVKIRNVSFRAVDAGIALSQGYYYSRDGATPLVEVELDCDVLILREWLVRYMPDQVKPVFASLATPGAAAPQ